MTRPASPRTFQLPAHLPEPRGQAFARAAGLLALQQSGSSALATAEARWGLDSPAARVLRAAVLPGTTADSAWAGIIADPGVREVFSAIRERSIMGRLAGMRRVPPNTHLVQQTGEATASWAKEAFAKPLTKLAYATGPALPVRKLQATVVATRELLMLSTPAAEDLFREDLLAAVTRAQDEAFIDPANAGVADTKPASITNGVTAIASTGDADGDVAALFANFAGDFETAFLIASGRIGAALASTTRPNAGARGGEISGVPLITSRNVPDTIIVMVDASGIAYFEEGAGMDRTENALLEMSDAPAGGAGAVLTSAWQANLVVLRVELFTNWARARSGSVAYVSGISYA